MNILIKIFAFPLFLATIHQSITLAFRVDQVLHQLLYGQRKHMIALPVVRHSPLAVADPSSKDRASQSG